ncbi:MAG TPA: POTRA domain-containing protein [Pyrinomonadaceae bacterium]
MNKVSHLLASIALILFGVAITKASVPGKSSFAPLQKLGVESLQEQGASKSSEGAEMRFEGLQNISESDVSKILREKRASISKEEIKDRLKLQKAESVIKEYLGERGYLNATVTIRKERISPTERILIFVINQGERIRIADIQFEGNKVFSGLQLLDSMKPARQNAGYSCSPPEEYDSDLLDFCLRRAQFHMRSKGYLQAKLDEPKKQMTEQGLKLIVPVREGELYRIGEIKIEGAKIFTAGQILGMLSLKTGDAANGEAIGQWLQVKVKTAYEELGHIQYEYEVEPTYNANPENVNEGIVDFQITISEGKRFVIRKIDFKGAKPMSNEELLRLVFVQTGEPYARKQLIDSVRNLYELGLSGGDADRDVDYRTNDEEGLLDIIFLLKDTERQAESNGGHTQLNRRVVSPN